MDESDVFPSDIDAEDNLVPAKKRSVIKLGSELVKYDNVASHRLVRLSGSKRVFLFHFTTPIETGALSWWDGLCISITQSALPAGVSAPGRFNHAGQVKG